MANAEIKVEVSVKDMDLFKELMFELIANYSNLPESVKIKLDAFIIEETE